ncbi:unnamed protein product, partial [Discosporangium mesarthrocarpum]
MLKAVEDAAISTARFVRRHRRSIVLGGLAGAAAYGYWRVKRLLREAEELHEKLVDRSREEARFRQCLARTRWESASAVVNFLPTLRSRLLMAVDVTGPVRELKAMRGKSGTGGGGGRAAADGTGGGGGGGGTG